MVLLLPQDDKSLPVALVEDEEKRLMNKSIYCIPGPGHVVLTRDFPPIIVKARLDLSQTPHL